MDPKELRGLYEAYSEVYAPQEEIGEAVKGADPEMRKAASAERRAGDKPLPKGEGEKYSKFKASQISYIDKKTKGKYIHGMTREEVEQVDEAIRNPESRAKLRSMMDREVRKGDKSKGENPRSKYPTEKGKQASHLLVGRDETGSEKAPVRKRGGTNAPSDERVGKGPNRAGNAAYWAGVAGPTRDRGSGNKAARRAAALKNEELDIFDTVLEFLQTEGFAETLEDAEFIMANDLNVEVIDDILEARKSYSATAAKAGKDIGKKGKVFGKIAREAGERYGSEERGKKVAGAILAKLRAKHG